MAEGSIEWQIPGIAYPVLPGTQMRQFHTITSCRLCNSSLSCVYSISRVNIISTPEQHTNGILAVKDITPSRVGWGGQVMHHQKLCSYLGRRRLLWGAHAGEAVLFMITRLCKCNGGFVRGIPCCSRNCRGVLVLLP